MSNDPKIHVKNYLSKNGYPFEMYIAKQFREAGFETYQSTIYKDAETGKDREVDVVAYYVKYYKDIQFSFKIIIECKHAKHPWVLFTGEDIGFSELDIDQIYCSNYAGGKLLEVLGRYSVWKNAFKIKKKIAYGITETSESQEGKSSFRAVNTLLGALKYEKDTPKNSISKVFQIFIPVIAIEGKLFECYLNDRNEDIIEEITEGQFLYKSNIYPDVFPSIEVITKENVPQLARKLYIDLDSIYSNHYGDIGHLIENYPTNQWGAF